MNKSYLTFTEETNALDYLERAAGFLREAETDIRAWKWAIIALHGALYGFAICANKGTDYANVTEKQRGKKLISFPEALKACQDPQRTRMTVMSKPLVLTQDQKAAIDKLQLALRNPFEHYIPMSWHIEIHGMPTIATHCLEVIQFLALETGNYTMLTAEQSSLLRTLVSDSIKLL